MARILIVEDDQDTQLMLHALLSAAGHDATTVGTFQAGLEALTAEPPDLLITDVRLGGYNGLQLVATAPTPVPAIVITGFRDPALELEAREMRAEYLVKPVSPRVLLDRIREKLVARDAGTAGAIPRRWMRKPVTAELAACIGDAPARIVDVSYGGVRFEVDRVAGRWLPLSFEMELPASQMSIGVDVVWKQRSGDSRWLCGAQVSDNRPRWREFVDAIS